MGLFTKTVLESLLFILPFCLMRKFSGGFHAKQEWQCLIGSCLVLVFCHAVIVRILCGVVLHILLLLSGTGLSVFSPVDSENRRLSVAEKEEYRHKAQYIVWGIIAVYGLLVWSELDEYAKWIAAGVILTFCLQIPCIWKNKK